MPASARLAGSPCLKVEPSSHYGEPPIADRTEMPQRPWGIL